ncbi:flagellar hook-length control protein FliK [Parvularcula dongshanensis]|uniref:Flagellar hook-length control protein FliK n=1 Tax=Parvularcula dongshanensis TaxID=1173995 RepID=A0A840I5P2_9PROT|nr:flagellar hook-length control protein FliK [Parvularcula dongshanensis]MBB4659635.1 flagellar hook-length control protein FliK [Parvularcula dongshanensis]
MPSLLLPLTTTNAGAAPPEGQAIKGDAPSAAEFAAILGGSEGGLLSLATAPATRTIETGVVDGPLKTEEASADALVPTDASQTLSVILPQANAAASGETSDSEALVADAAEAAEARSLPSLPGGRSAPVPVPVAGGRQAVSPAGEPAESPTPAATAGTAEPIAAVGSSEPDQPSGLLDIERPAPSRANRDAAASAEAELAHPSADRSASATQKPADLSMAGPSALPEGSRVPLGTEPMNAPPTQTSGVGNASAPSRLETQAAPAPGEPAMQVLDAVRLRSDERSVTVRLDPPDLGRVQIEFDFHKRGAVTALVSTDNPDTGALLRRHADWLQRELTAAGLGDATLSWGQASQGGGDDADRQRMSQLAFHVHDLPAAPAAARPAPASGRIDLRL